MKEIGAYFGLELTDTGQHYHTGTFQFQTGRAALYFILVNVQPRHVYIPFYTSDALLEPLLRLKIPYIYYAINSKFEIQDLPYVADDELLIYINYFDIKRTYIDKLSSRLKDKLVIDCTMSYFLKGNGSSWYYNSARRFFGVPDGADLYSPLTWRLRDNYRRLETNTIFSTDQLMYAFRNPAIDEHEDYLHNERLVGLKYDKMSQLSRCLLSHVDFYQAKIKRNDNFNYLHGKLQKDNQLVITPDDQVAPSYYPFLPCPALSKKQFENEKINIRTFWADCINRPSGTLFGEEKTLCRDLLAIPIDHRYDFKDLDHLLNCIFKLH